MTNYRKLIAALVGLALLVLKRHTGLELPGASDILVEVGMSAATAFSVWAFPNTPKATPSDSRPVS